MIALLVELVFTCCKCGNEVGVKLKCEGKGLAEGGDQIAAVMVPCPHCHSINQVLFEPSGTVRAVRPCRATCGTPAPSLN